jgi:hypothetical protein
MRKNVLWKIKKGGRGIGVTFMLAFPYVLISTSYIRTVLLSLM